MWSPNRTMVALAERDGWVCAYCERPLAHRPEHVIESVVEDYLTGKREVAYVLADARMAWPATDHVVPSSRGGLDTLENRVLSCGTCNNRKGVKPVDVFLLDLIGEAR